MKKSSLRLMFLFIFSLLLISEISAQSEVDSILKTSDITPGMKGYGLTTIRGDQLVRYPIEVLSVMGNRGSAWPHFRSILIKIGDGEKPDGFSGFNADMAGSPIYINDKLVGAVSSFFDWSLQEVATVSPIEEMMLISQRHRNLDQSGASQKRQTLLDNFTSGNINATKTSAETDPLKPNSQIEKPRALQPGDAVAAVWSIGDYTQYAKGNITVINPENEFFAFGKSVFGRSGPVNAPLIRSEVLDTMKGLDTSQQITNPGFIVGTILEDRSSGVFGKLGVKPDMAAVDVTIHDVRYGKTYKAMSLVIKDERFYPSLIPTAVSHSIRKQLDTDWRGTADIKFEVVYKVDSGAEKTYGGRNLFYGDNIPSLAVTNLTETLLALTENDFGRVELQGVNVEVFWTPERETSRIESIEIAGLDKRDKEDEKYVFKRGEELDITLKIRPYKKELVEKKISLKIDKDFPTGSAVLQVRGGGLLLPPGDDMSKDLLKRIDDGLKARIKNLEKLPPSGLEDLLDKLPGNEPNNRRILELISTEKTPALGVARFNQVDIEDLDTIVYGFDSIQLKIKD